MSRPSLSTTPEQLLGRNDSKNPSTTCRGITSAGRPCRRALAVSKLAAGHAQDGVVALIHKDDRLTDAQYFCWQHKDQITNLPVPAPSKTRRSSQAEPRREILELRSRDSISSLMQNLNIHSEKQQVVPGPRVADKSQTAERARRSYRAPPKEPSLWRSLCCMLAAEDDDTIEIIRHKQRVRQGRTSRPTTVATPDRTKPKLDGGEMQPGKSDPSQPLSFIKPGTSPLVAASLLTELTKPISPHDEDGYIYIFWLTPSSCGVPRQDTATSLLSPSRRGARRLSDVMSDFSIRGEQASTWSRSQRKIMLKIGRANNVTRRMNEWQRQCGYELSLVRWYPYVTQEHSVSAHQSPGPDATLSPLYPDMSRHVRPTTTRSNSSQVRKVPCAKRVERLIHIELCERQVRRLCDNCGREHREWFTIDATEQGIRQVDETIRRWIEWSEVQHAQRAG